jgi:hypothetical protein
LEESLLELKDGSWRNLGEYAQYLKDPAYERRDFTKKSSWIVDNEDKLGSKPLAEIQTRRDGTRILVAPVNDSTDLKVSGYIVKSIRPGTIRLLKT